jgi:uncharacterized membrane protein YfcA
MEFAELSCFASAVMVLVIVIASVISSVTGMAGGILMFSGMGLFIPLQPLIALHGTVQVFGNASRAWFLRHALLWPMILPFAIGAIIGAALTTVLIASYVPQWLPLMLLLGLISYSLLRPKSMPALRIADRNFFWVGLLTGSLGIIAGAIDPLLAAFFLRDDLNREQVVANKTCMQLVSHLTKIPAFIYLGFAFSDHWQSIALFGTAAIFGSRLGVYLLQKIDNALFFKLMRIALCLAALRIFYQLLDVIFLI